MKANEVKLDSFLQSQMTQFIIPVYQRNYDWTFLQCKQLMDDILNVGKDDNQTSHFIGSIVYVHDAVYSSTQIKELSIIDGQQRLTTITLIYIAIYKLAIKLKDENLKNQINEFYLINKYATEDEKLKLRPTENNDKALKSLLRGDNPDNYTEFSRVIVNYNFMNARINKDNYIYYLKGLSKLIFVEISLDRNYDNPQKIFESLNSTGLDLSQADLIRNYILMGLDRITQKKIYEKYWCIIEQLSKDEATNISMVSDFIRDYLTLVNKKIPNKNKVYIEFKEKYPTGKIEDLEKVLERLKSLVIYYNKIINPKNEADTDIRLQLEYINRLEINVSYPFLMKVYEDYYIKQINKATFIEILELIQSFVWRRFILDLPTNALNKIFMRLYEDIDVSKYLYSLQKSLLLKKGKQRFPKNTETINALKEKDIYNIKSKNTNYFLERLENHENREFVAIFNNPNITIEHIFPIHPEPKWKVELKEEEYNFIKDNYLNTISNLTLSGNNGKLGNKNFVEKRDMNKEGKEQGYKYSRLWLNKYLSSLEKWDKNEIEKRFKLISERFLKIWQYPEITIEEDENNEEINIFDAPEPKFKKLEYVIFLDTKIKIREVSKLYILIMTQLFEMQPEIFFSSNLGQKIGLSKNKKELRAPVKINETYFIESNLDNTGKFEKIKYALELLDLEDELIIKYANERK